MKALFTGLFLAITVFSFCQKAPIKFGNIPQEDLEMKIYSHDSSAAAVVLCDYGEAYFSGSTFSMIFERHVRIKILKTEGLGWADGQIIHHNTQERITNLKAATYSLENGQVVETKMSKESIFKEKFNRYRDVIRFTLPNVKAGSVIEYSYKLTSDYAINFPNWSFQYTIPVIHSEYSAAIPDIFIFEKYMQGYLTVSDYEVKSQNMAGYVANIHRWRVKNAPAFIREPYMTSEQDYISKINFAISHINVPGQPVREIMGSWTKLNDVLLESESFGGAIKGSGFLKREVEAITAGITDPKEKVKAIHNYVKKNFEWDGYEDYTADPLKQVFEKKKGTSGDLNILLASMLEKAEIPLDMVMLSTREHGFVRKQYPMERQFNYVVVAARVDDTMILLDATEKYIPMNVLPDRCLNGEGLVISKTRHGWINLETKTKARTVVSADLVMSGNGELTGKLNYSRDGYDALRMRKDFTSKGKDVYLKDYAGNKSWLIENSEFLNLDNTDQPVKENHDVTISDHSSVTGNVIYLNPFVTAQMTSNPFVLNERLYPVDFGSSIEQIYTCKLQVPEGFTVDELPKPKLMALPGNGAKYMYNVVQTGNTISITSLFQINKNFFTQEEYPNLKEFYNQVVAKQAEQIVFKKN